MAAKDAFHEAVRVAIEKDGWLITHDPLYLSTGGVEFYVDLGAEPLIAAEKGDEKIAIEIKSFTAPSTITAFHTAVGQFMNYRRALAKVESTRHLYLAVPIETFNTFFILPFIREAVEDYRLHLLVYDAEEQVVTKWIT